jgi:hypothetical protein
VVCARTSGGRLPFKISVAESEVPCHPAQFTRGSTVNGVPCAWAEVLFVSLYDQFGYGVLIKDSVPGVGFFARYHDR